MHFQAIQALRISLQGGKAELQTGTYAEVRANVIGFKCQPFRSVSEVWTELGLF